jgi:hypothetical protein
MDSGTGGGQEEDRAAIAPQSLIASMEREIRTLRRGTRSYGITYHASRVALITASAIVAADQNLKGHRLGGLVDWVPALALLVAILTALDTWLKPQQKWKGFMESRDDLADLLFQCTAGLSDDAARQKFAELRKEHRERNIF